MTRKRFVNVLIFVCLAGYFFAFTKRESFFPFTSFDVYRKPLPEPSFTGFQSTNQARYVARFKDGRSAELGPFHAFFYPFDRFIYSEVVFFNIIRVQERHPLEFKELILNRLGAHLKDYNRRRRSQRKQIAKLEVHAAQIHILPTEGDGTPSATVSLGPPLFEVSGDD